jgi:hypothetical protein
MSHAKSRELVQWNRFMISGKESTSRSVVNISTGLITVEKRRRNGIKVLLNVRMYQQKHRSMKLASLLRNSCALTGKVITMVRIHVDPDRFSNYTTAKKYLLQRHLKSHSTERPHKCRSRIEARSNISFQHYYSGGYCERSFKTTIQLTNHVNTHLGVKPFQVDYDANMTDR